MNKGIVQFLTCPRGIERYLELLKDSKIRGYLFEQQNYVPKS